MSLINEALKQAKSYTARGGGRPPARFARGPDSDPGGRSGSDVLSICLMFVGLIVVIMAAAGAIYYFHRSRSAQETEHTEAPDTRPTVAQAAPELPATSPRPRKTSLGTAHQKGVDAARLVQARQVVGMTAAEAIRPPAPTAGTEAELPQALGTNAARTSGREAAPAPFEARIDARRALGPSRAQLAIKEPGRPQTAKPPPLQDAPSPAATAVGSAVAAAPAITVAVKPAPTAMPAAAEPVAPAQAPAPAPPSPAAADTPPAPTRERAAPPRKPSSPPAAARPHPRPAPDDVRRAYRLTGIFGTASGYSALVNSRVVRPGQTVGAAFVEKVGEDHVELKIDGAVFVLDMARPPK